MLVFVRVSQRLARSPWMYWLLVAAVAVLAAALVARAMAGVDAARDTWGEARAVFVATADIAPGERIAGSARQRDLPRPVVPPSAVGELEPAAVARQSIRAGEVIVRHDVAAAGGPQALIPQGWIAVPVAESVPSGARPGDRVRVAAAGAELAPDGVVVGTAPGIVLVAVAADRAAPLAQASASGDAVVMLTG